MGYKVKKIRVGTQQIRPAGWKPNTNTYIYYPFTSDLVDQMGNGNTGSINGSGITFNATNGIYVPGKTSGAYITGLSNGIANKSGPRTVNLWVKVLTNVPSSGTQAVTFLGNDNNADSQSFKVTRHRRFRSDNLIERGVDIRGAFNVRESGSTPDNDWINYCITFSGTEYIGYINGNFSNSTSSSKLPNNYPEMRIGNCGYYSDRQGDGYVKDYIVETKVRTAQEILDYYNQTKGNYGL